MKKVIGWNNQKVTLLVIAVVIGGFFIGTVTGQAARKIGGPGGGGTGTTTTVLPYCSSAPATQTFLVRDGDFSGSGYILPRGDDNCLNNNPDDPDCWKWRVGELYSGSISGAVGNIQIGETTFKGPTLGLSNDFTINDDKDNPPTVGDCLNLPNNFAKICIDSLNILDTDYNTYEVRYDNSKDLSNGGTPSQTSEPVIEIAALQGLDNGLLIDNYNFSDSGPTVFSSASFVTESIITGTDKIWLHINDTTPAYIDIFFENPDNRPQWAGSIKPVVNNKVNNVYQIFGEVNYRNTNGQNIRIGLQKSGGLGLVLDILGEEGSVSRNSVDDIRLSLKNSTTAFLGFGSIAQQSEPRELMWGWARANRTIGTKDEDHRTIYGIIIRDPDLSLASDTLTLEVPADQVKAVVSIKGCNAQGVCGGVIDEIPLNTSLNAPGFFNAQLEDNQLANFQDTFTRFNNQDIDIHDELDLGTINSFVPLTNSGPIIVTSLSAGDDDYEGNVYMEIPRNSITYSYLFDEMIRLNTTQYLNPLTIKMLGKTVNIVGINSSLSFTHRAGYCGDRICRHEFNEYCDNCAVDCGTCTAPVCGNRVCEILESCNTCSTDCGTCPV